MNTVFRFDYATVRRLYNSPFIDHDKVMTGSEFLSDKKMEAKEIIINQMKRKVQEKTFREILADSRTTARVRQDRTEKIRALRIMDYLSEQ